MISPTELAEETTVQGDTAVAEKLSGGNTGGFTRLRELALLCGAILPLALLLRLLTIGAKSLDEDEIFSALLARQNWQVYWKVVTQSQGNSALYYALLKIWVHLGHNEFAIRSFSAIAGLATVAAIYSLGTRAFGRRVGILGALLLAINGFHIQYSQDAGAYGLLALLVTLSSLFFLKSVHEDSRRNWILYIVTSTLAIYAHIFAAFVLLAQWVSLFFVPRGKAPWKRLESVAIIAFLSLPMEMYVLFRHAGFGWVPKTTVRGIFILFTHLAGGAGFDPGYGTAILLCAYSIPVIIAILALLKSDSWSLDLNEAWHESFFLTWLAVPIVLVLLISMRSPMFVDRFLIICLPPFILLAAYGCSRVREPWLVAILLCVIAGLTAPGLARYYKRPDQDWKAAAQYILSKEKPGDAAVFSPGYYGSRLAYYLQVEPIRLAPALVWDADRAAAGGTVITGQPLSLLVPEDTAFGTLLQDLPARYGRVWVIRNGEATQDQSAQQRKIGATVGGEFRGISSEQRFPSNNLVVSLYEGKRSANQPEPVAAPPNKVVLQAPAARPLAAEPENNTAQTGQPRTMAATETAKVHITSSPTWGEIYVDGKFYGDTPSDITLPAGERTVKITIGGKVWSRSVEITPGEITLRADMTH